MSVIIDPQDALQFPRPREDGTKKVITVTNANAFMVAFKFKTTAPKHYCVRPNSGYIPAGGKVEVLVLFQIRDDIPDNGKCKDKFLVLSMRCENDLRDTVEFWANAEASRKGEMQEQKLRCEFTEDAGPALSTSPSAPAATLSDASSPSQAQQRAPPPIGDLPDPRAVEAEWARDRDRMRREIDALKSELAATKQQLLEAQVVSGKPVGGRGDVITKTVVSADHYSPQTVLIVAALAFLVGVILY